MLTLDTIAPNLTRITMGTRAGYQTSGDRVTVWFSYTTPIAVHAPGMAAPLTSVNEWAATTGKHLGIVDGGTKEARARRVSHETVMQEVDRLTPATA